MALSPIVTQSQIPPKEPGVYLDEISLGPCFKAQGNFNTEKWGIKLENELPFFRCLLGESNGPQDTGSITQPWGYNIFINSFQDHGGLNISGP